MVLTMATTTVVCTTKNSDHTRRYTTINGGDVSLALALPKMAAMTGVYTTKSGVDDRHLFYHEWPRRVIFLSGLHI